MSPKLKLMQEKEISIGKINAINLKFKLTLQLVYQDTELKACYVKTNKMKSYLNPNHTLIKD